jgi:nucleoid-associated protein YgaU
MQAIPDLVIKNGRIVTAHEAEHRGHYKAAWVAAALVAIGMGSYGFKQGPATPSATPLTEWPAPVQPASALATTEPKTPQGGSADASLAPSSRTRILSANAMSVSGYEKDRAVQASPTILQTTSAQDAQTRVVKNEAFQRQAESQTYVVREGDTLWTIARQVYGDPHQYKRLLEANPSVMASPEHIFPGQVLRVPA